MDERIRVTSFMGGLPGHGLASPPLRTRGVVASIRPGTYGQKCANTRVQGKPRHRDLKAAFHFVESTLKPEAELKSTSSKSNPHPAFNRFLVALDAECHALWGFEEQVSVDVLALGLPALKQAHELLNWLVSRGNSALIRA